jgi:hypothetical protein
MRWCTCCRRLMLFEQTVWTTWHVDSVLLLLLLLLLLPVRTLSGFTPCVINVGGGLGIDYARGSQPLADPLPRPHDLIARFIRNHALPHHDSCHTPSASLMSSRAEPTVTSFRQTPNPFASHPPIVRSRAHARTGPVSGGRLLCLGVPRAWREEQRRSAFKQQLVTCVISHHLPN